MPEHVHLLVNEPTVKPLSTVIQILKQKTSQALKSTIEPQFWQRHYYDFNVRTKEKTVEKLRYMHRNPVTRGLVSNPQDWPWSSYRHYQTGQKGTIEVESHWTAYHREHPPKSTRSSVNPTLPAMSAERMGHPQSRVRSGKGKRKGWATRHVRSPTKNRISAVV